MIHLIRHGQTDWNLFKRANGQVDTFLNQTGIEQARLKSEELKNINLDLCFCSTQTRARQFCEIVCECPVVFDERLIEINCGEFEGTEETSEMMKLLWNAAQRGDRGVERFDAFMKRNIDLCDEIAMVHKGKDILIITHAANARVINYYLSGKPKDYDFTKSVGGNCELISFEN